MERDTFQFKDLERIVPEETAASTVDDMVHCEEWNPSLSWEFSQIKFSMQGNLS